MALTNSILIISDKQEDIIKFRSKIILLREIDTVIESDTEKAFESCRKYIPDTIIIFVHDKNDNLFEICKKIRKDSILKVTPIFMIFNFFDEQYILSCFDSGMSDYMVLPARDSEILMKVIWNLQKSEMARELEKKEILLSDLGAIDRKNEAYTFEFTPKVFTNEINTARKYKYPVVMMAICLDDNTDKNKNNFLASIIKKYIRTSDIMGIAGAGKFYIFMPRTEEKGGYAVYNRIRKHYKNEFSISAGLCESKGDMDFEFLSSCASNALNDAISRGGNRVIVFNRFEESKEDSNMSKEWLKKIQSDKKSYEIFKNKFSKKAFSVISPVFEQIKKDMEEKFKNTIVIEQFITDTNCFFSIKEPVDGTQISLKITDPGFEKVMIDQFNKFAGKTVDKRSTLEIMDLTEETVVNILKNLFKEFKSIDNKQLN
ncbi:MAG: hypothetical protein PHC34_00050 [Candidatus Gastranaerophilales bacterium]|nr:hypothetical protein [Candidatus Gastranaerophilales bacterium]